MTKRKEKICDGVKIVLSFSEDRIESKFNMEKKFDWSTL